MKIEPYIHEGKRYFSILQLSGLLDWPSAEVYKMFHSFNLLSEQVKLESEQSVRKLVPYEFAKDFIEHCNEIKCKELDKWDGRGKFSVRNEYICNKCAKSWLKKSEKKSQENHIPKYVADSLTNKEFMTQLEHIFKYVRDHKYSQPSK